ncbi:FAD-dependent oxidoreductase [Hwanghaeella sp.]|uniref:oxidoreductase n=1 Tax=Hwanghaeella sp. TaxID=2605943 RepID=UPI003CCC1162
MQAIAPSKAQTDPLLQPFRLKHLTLRNRVMSTSHACGLGDADGMPGETYQRYHEEKAKGGLALTMFGGSSYISPDSTWASGQLNVGTDKVIPFLQDFADRIHRHGAAIMIQITHLGRRGESNTQNWLPTIAPSPIREALHRTIPREMDRNDIDRVVKAFGDAAYRCREGGLDGLETMMQGHLIGQFMSPATNRRTDEFGGSVENRCRFALMVHEEIRNRVGDDFIVGMRYGIDEAMQGGMDFEECLQAARVLERSGLLDFFNANYGRIDKMMEMAEQCMPGMSMPIAPWLEKAGAFKREIGLPVFHAARITDLATARHAIRDGLLDMVAMTRAHIADPQIVNKLTRGEEDRIRPCVGATHCMGANRPTCLHNPASGRDRFWPQVIEKTDGPIRKVVIIGAGPSGLEAARVSAERGHDVILFEAAEKPGGQLRMATAASWRKDVTGIIEWRVSELEKLGVDLRTGIYAEALDILAESPDVVIIATGGVPDLDGLEGAELCTSPWDILTGTATSGETAVIYDGTGRHPAPTVAEFLARQGKSVDLVMLDDVPGKELDYAEQAAWKKRIAQEHIPTHAEYGLRAVSREGNGLSAVFTHELTGEEMRIHCDTVIVENGTMPADEVYQELRAASANDGYLDLDALLAGEPQPSLDRDGVSLFRIGDAASSRNVAAAMFDALRLCSRL